MPGPYSKAAAPRNTAATKVVAENWRSDEAALKVGEAVAAVPDPEAVPVPEPVPVLEPVPVAAAEEPVAVAEPEETAVTKPVAVELSEVPVEVEVAVETSVAKKKIISNRFNDVTCSGVCVDPYQLCGRAGRSC